MRKLTETMLETSAQDLRAESDRDSHLVQLWDSEYFTRDGDADVSKNYLGIPLLCRDTDVVQLHVSVHLPHKRGKVQARRNLQAYILERADDYREIYLHGDFNLDHEGVQQLFPEHLTTISDLTTEISSIDNVLVPFEVEYRPKIVRNSVLSHAPILTTVWE
jgi:hypothetical protein